MPESESIAVIGCGPGGMFFCHALETMRLELLEKGESVDHLPTVTVFERDHNPGGVWRSNRNATDKAKAGKGAGAGAGSDDVGDNADAELGHNTQMYEALWTNGAKEGIEFFDYTYDDHFQRQLPVYMPRRALLEYMLARVTNKCPDFFDKYVQFQTSVANVVYNDETGGDEKFHITTSSAVTGATRTQIFDRCLWAAGDNGRPNMPQSVLTNLEGFAGRIIHSTDTATFQEDVAGKRVLIIGGSYSAEDLALMSCKLNAERVYICSRADAEDSPVAWTGEWPEEKVECLPQTIVMGVEHDSTIVLQTTEWIRDDIYEIDDEEDETKLENIDTIILCTGYHQQFDMLQHREQSWVCVEKTATYPVPSDWKMEENALTPLVGDVAPPAEARFYESVVGHADVYRGLLIDNPKMMFLRHEHDDYPILNTDVMAWMLLQFCTGNRDIPSAIEMRRQNVDQALYEMKHFPSYRLIADANYAAAYKAAAEEDDPEWELAGETEWDYFHYDFRIMARSMQEARYPLCIGTHEELNEKGAKLYEYALLSVAHRTNATTTTTFRDADDSHKFASIYTGTEAIPLKKPWLEMDENGDEELV